MTLIDKMSIIHGASLQSFNNEIIKNKKIEQEESEKQNLSSQLKHLQNQLDSLQHSLEKKYIVKKEYDRLIKETELAYRKIVDSSRTLLDVVKKQSKTIHQETEI